MANYVSRRGPGVWVAPIVLLLLLFAAAPAWANVYASCFAKTGDYTCSYVLNEDADTNVQIQVWEVGGAQVYSEDLGPQTKGSHTWTWDGTGSAPGASYKVKVAASASGHTSWTQISDDSTYCQFENPRGVAVDTYQDTGNFGKIFVSNVRALPTASGRTMQNGTYVLNADCTDAGFYTGGVAWSDTSTTTAARHGMVGPDGHLYLADYTNDVAYEFSEDMSTATQLTDHSNLTNDGLSTAQYVRDLVVSGTGADRALYLVNSNYYDTTRKGVIEYDLGTNTKVAADDKGTQWIGPSYFIYYPFDARRGSDGNWYVSQYRGTAGQAPVLSKFYDVSDENPPPLDAGDIIWEASDQYTYNQAFDICEPKQQMAYCNVVDGNVYLFDMTSGAYLDQFAVGTETSKTPRDIAYDAAGNLVTVDNYTERMRVWSPGDGANSFTSQSWFTFDIVGTSQTVTIVVDPTGAGTTTGAGTYTSGQSVTVTATYNEGYRFVKWTDESGTQLSTSTSYTFVMPQSDLNLHAVFTATSQRELHLVSVPPEGAATLTGEGWYNPGTGVSVSATPAEHYHFVKWTSDAAGNNLVNSNASFTYTMPGSTTTLYAQFALDSTR